MMERNGNLIRSVAWTELFPWLSIFKIFRLAIGFRALAMSALAVLLTATAWSLLGFGITSDSCSADPKTCTKCPLKELIGVVPDEPEFFGDSQRKLLDNFGSVQSMEEMKAVQEKVAEYNRAHSIYEPLTGSWAFLSRPLWAGFGIDITLGRTLRLIACGLISLAIWAFFGAAITRIAAVQLAVNERITWGASLRYACSKFFAYFSAPLFPLVGIALAALFIFVVSLLLRWDIGVFFVSLIWPVFLILGFAMAIILIGLVFGWPLMWPTISTEGTDSFDALSRSYAAIYQRPLHYLFYIAVAMFLGFLGWIFVKNFAATTVWATYWASSWGTGASRIEHLVNYQTPTGAPLTGMGYAGAWLIHFWTDLTKMFAVGFCFSYFWNASASIYLLMRRDIDATEMDEVYLDADEGEAIFGLPKIVIDDAGAPEVEEKPTKTPEAAPPAPNEGE